MSTDIGTGVVTSRPPWARGLKLNSTIYEASKAGRAPRGRVD